MHKQVVVFRVLRNSDYTTTTHTRFVVLRTKVPNRDEKNGKMHFES